jgi:cephalosporin hydroxylase
MVKTRFIRERTYKKVAESLNTSSGLLSGKLQRLRNNYLDLMQSCLTGSVYRDLPQSVFGLNMFDSRQREHGLDWPAQAQTMIGEKRMANLRTLMESVIADNVPGDFIETGVWRGGACIFMRAILYVHNIGDRCVWVADSFEGLPAANELENPADAGSPFHTYPQLAVPIEQVRENFRVYGLLDQQTKFLKGWFKDTLPTAPIRQLALMRLDGDMYESTMDGLTNLYPKLSHQGYVIVDDYHAVPACKAAVHDYCDANEMHPEIIEIDGVGVYWRKFDTTKDANVSVASSHSGMSDEMQISLLNEALFELSWTVITYLNQSLTARDGDVARLNQSLTERDGQLAARDGDVARLNQALADRDGDVARLNQALADRDGDVARLQKELSALYSSKSWRVTKPLRSIGHIIRGSRGNDDKVRPPHTIDSSMVNSPITRDLSPKLIWEDDVRLTINDVGFYLSMDTEELKAGKSTSDSFLLGKPKHQVEKAVNIGQQQRINKIFEMGILHGGSVVLYDQIFRPEKIVAIEHSLEPVESLANYIAKRRKSRIVKPYYRINQADRSAMEKILSAEFPDRDVDLIIDDASHLYEETREAFNISFPYLKNGGLYIIEDWAWAHWSGDCWQKDHAGFSEKKSLSNLLIELFMLAASCPGFVKDIVVEPSVITVSRGDEALPAGPFNIADHYLLRGKHFGAWL